MSLQQQDNVVPNSGLSRGILFIYSHIFEKKNIVLNASVYSQTSEALIDFICGGLTVNFKKNLNHMNDSILINQKTQTKELH